ncbi:MAG: D-amino acid dehydrogenase [Alphaproteobacteria bacterium]
MKVVVLGGGVIGVTTAHYLAVDGHQVEVIDRAGGPGLETSFANGGQLVASHAEPWASPKAPLQILKWLGREEAPLLLRLRADPAMWAWGLRFLRNCTASRYRAGLARNLRLGIYNRLLLAELREAFAIAFDYTQNGSLLIYRKAASFEEARGRAALMSELGCALEIVDPVRCTEIEPALTPAGKRIAGGLFCAQDEIGDAYKFTKKIAAICRKQGVRFRYDARIEAIEAEGGRIVGLATDGAPVTGDAFVLALGSFSALPARGIGLRLPVYPVKGYSITAPIKNQRAAPRVGLSDVEARIVLTRLGSRLRVAGTAEFTGYDNGANARRGALTVRSAKTLLPDACDYDKAEHWSGLRSATPDQVPVLGPTKYPNLWLNTGHGALGWTQACASARIVADLIAGRDPGIDISGMAMDRF